MKPTPFTPKIGDEIIEKMKSWNKRDQHFMVCSGVRFQPKVEWVAEGWACHRYAHEELLAASHPDIMGFVYQGVRPYDKPYKMTKTGIAYLRCLVDPEGPFKEVLPYLYHSEWKQIIKDNGIVAYNLSDKKLNAGLFWTFIQATRLLFEHKEHAPRFEYLRKYFKDPAWTLLATIALQPVQAKKLDGNWAPCIPQHCSPLGQKPWIRAKGFLSGKLIHHPEHATLNSSMCFGGGIPSYSYETAVKISPKPLDEWVKGLLNAA
jgi:hypothetical protein